LTCRSTDDQRLTQSTQVKLVDGKAWVITEWVVDTNLSTDIIARQLTDTCSIVVLAHAMLIDRIHHMHS